MATSIAALTDQDRVFSVNTYESGDGAPEGDYTVTFMWGQYNLACGSYGGPDKLKGEGCFYSPGSQSTPVR